MDIFLLWALALSSAWETLSVEDRFFLLLGF